MKKWILLLLVLALLLSAGCQQTPDPTEAPTQPSETESQPSEPETLPTDPTETEPPVPDTREQSLLAPRVPVILALLSRGQEVELVADYDDTHYIVKAGELYGLVEKRLLRTQDQTPYTPWTGYTYHNAKFCSDLHLLDAQPQKLSQNTQVEVLEDLGYVLLVQHGDTLGFMKPKDVSKHYIQYSGGGSGGGADGGDIELRLQPGLLGVPQSGEVIGTATVLADGTELILDYADGAVAVIAEEGFAQSLAGYEAVWMDGLCAYIHQRYLAQPDAPAYETWVGYADFSANVYGNFYLLGDAVSKPGVNTKLTVIGELDNCYILDLGDAVGFIARDKVKTQPVYVGSGGGGGDEWSPPAM